MSTSLIPSRLSLEEYLVSVSRGRRGIVPGLLRMSMGALAPLYCLGLKTFLMPYRMGARRQTRLSCPVVSIGNLTTGGTGKTPMTQTLCRALAADGLQVAVLSRGYGGGFERGCGVVSDTKRVRLTAKEAGDEAFLLACTLPGVPVLVGKDRRETGRLAIAEFQPDLLVLDDGMQFWQLHRNLDVVLLNACDPFDNGWTFPRGLLREPPSHLRRAGVVVLTHVQRAGKEAVENLIGQVRQFAPGCPIFSADLAPSALVTLLDREPLPMDWLSDRRVTAVSAVANPSSFESMIGDLGGILAARFRFRDHQALTLPELERVFTDSCAAGAEAIIITEKDAVKIPPLKSPLPLVILQVRMRIEGEAHFLRSVRTALQQENQGLR